MRDLTALRSLAERLGKATGADRELDGAIYIALFVPMERAGRIDHDRGVVGWWPKDGPYVSAVETPHYTASIDAAEAVLKLLLPGLKARLDFDARPRCYLYREKGIAIGAMAGDWSHYADAETMPLAILRAAVAGLIAQAEAGRRD